MRTRLAMPVCTRQAAKYRESLVQYHIITNILPFPGTYIFIKCEEKIHIHTHTNTALQTQSHTKKHWMLSLSLSFSLLCITILRDERREEIRQEAWKLRRTDKINGFSVSIQLGLDPAKPAFEDTSDKDGHLDKSDAEFVDIIHSCAGLLGYAKPLGHV